MRKLLKALVALSFVFTLMLAATSCSSEYDFYEDWSEAGAEIEKDNIFEVITLDEAKAKIANKDTFVLLYASSSAPTAVRVVNTLQAQAEYLGASEDAVIYFVDATDYTTSSDRNLVKEALKIRRDVPDNGSPVVMTYNAGIVYVDTTWTDKIATKQFVFNGSVDYSCLASYIFKELLA